MLSMSRRSILRARCAVIGDITICASPVTTTVSPICSAVEAADLREKQRHQIGRAVKAGADHESVERAEREIAVGKGAQIDDRLMVGQHPPEEQDAEAMLDTMTAARIVSSASQSQRGPSWSAYWRQPRNSAISTSPSDRNGATATARACRCRSVSHTATATAMPGTMLTRNSQCQEKVSVKIAADRRAQGRRQVQDQPRSAP